MIVCSSARAARIRWAPASRVEEIAPVFHHSARRDRCNIARLIIAIVLAALIRSELIMKRRQSSSAVVLRFARAAIRAIGCLLAAYQRPNAVDVSDKQNTRQCLPARSLRCHDGPPRMEETACKYRVCYEVNVEAVSIKSLAVRFSSIVVLLQCNAPDKPFGVIKCSDTC